MEMLILTKERRAHRVMAAKHATETITVGIAGSCNVGPSMFTSLKTVCFTCETAVQIFLCFMDTRRNSLCPSHCTLILSGSNLGMFHHCEHGSVELVGLMMTQWRVIEGFVIT